MILHFNDPTDRTLDIPVDDDSCRYRAIRGDHNLTLRFSLAEPLEIPVGAWTEFEGERYELEQPANILKNHTRSFKYTLVLEAAQAKLRRYRFRNPVDKRLVFSFTARPREHLQMLVDNLNLRESGWRAGECIDAVEKVVSYNHASCIDALEQMADAFNTEYEIVGKTIHLRRVAYNLDDPLPLSYGRGNGFRPGVGRTNYSGSKPVEVLFVQGGEENIDPNRYGSKSLLLPRSATLRYDGTHFEDEAGFDDRTARTYATDADGLSVRRADKPLQTGEEASLDCSHIAPKRVGTVTSVEFNAGWNSYSIVDSTIPAGLDYSTCQLAGETMTVIFQSGMLAGKEFETNYYHEAANGKGGRRFEIVPQDLDGQTMPNETFKPAVGDTYAVFHTALPEAYLCDDASRSGASWEMFRESVRYFSDNEVQKFTFTGGLDGIWAKKDWNNIGGRIRLGGYVLFSDAQFQTEGVAIRIVGIKEFINNPHSPELELSNEPVGHSVGSQLRKIDETEAVVEEQHRKALQFTKRRFRNSLETLEMMRSALLDRFTGSIDPVAVQTMAMLVGDQSLQFRFVESKANPVPVPDGVAYDPSTKILSVTAGTIQHMTLGIDTISAGHDKSEYKFWDIPAYQSPPLTDGQKKYYLYAVVSPTANRGRFRLSETAIALKAVVGTYYLLIGVLNSEYDGERSYVSLYGFTEIVPGRITTDKIVSTDGKTYFDLLRSEIGGKINFKDGLVSGIVGIGNDNGLNAGMSGDGTAGTSVRFWAGETAQNRTKAPFRVIHDGSLFSTKGTIGGWSITDSGIVSNELTQYNPGDGSQCKSRMYLNSDGTIAGDLLNVNSGAGQIKCSLWDAPILEWTPRYLKMHARVAVPFEVTTALYDSSGAGPDGLDVFYIKHEITNNIIVSPVGSAMYYDLIGGLEAYNGVTLRIYNPATRSGNFKPANAYLRFREALGKPLIPFLGKFTGTELSIPVGKMVVLTGVSEQVAGGNYGLYNPKWYVELTA